MYRFKFFLSSGESAPGGALAPVLAPFGLDLFRVSREINQRSTELFPKGFPITVKLFLAPDKSYKIFVGRPPLSFYFNSLFAKQLKEGQLVNPLDFFNLVLLLQLETSISVEKLASLLFGSLSSFHGNWRSLRFFVS